MLDHAIPLNERHLMRLSLEYTRYYHDDGTHLGLNMQTPGARPTEMRPDLGSTIRSESRIGGLHHRYSGQRQRSRRARTLFGPSALLAQSPSRSCIAGRDSVRARYQVPSGSKQVTNSFHQPTAAPRRSRHGLLMNDRCHRFTNMYVLRSASAWATDSREAVSLVMRSWMLTTCGFEHPRRLISVARSFFNFTAIAADNCDNLIAGRDLIHSSEQRALVRSTGVRHGAGPHRREVGGRRSGEVPIS